MGLNTAVALYVLRYKCMSLRATKPLAKETPTAGPKNSLSTLGSLASPLANVTFMNVAILWHVSAGYRRTTF